MATSEKEASQSTEITIVIGTLNRPFIVMQLVEQLIEEAKKIHMEVIVVDQSLPENYTSFQNQFPKLENFSLVHFDTPNTCKYLNYGWKNAKAPIILYLDDDVSLTDTTIKAHLDAYANLSIKGVAGRVINDGEPVSTDQRVGKILWLGAEFTKNFSYEKKALVDFPYGCNMSFRKQALEEMEGFDEHLSPPIYSFNEVDLGYRISRKWNNSLVFIPEALVYHHQHKKGGTRNDFELKKVREGNDFNYGYFLGKNLSCFEAFLLFLRRLPYQILKEPFSILDITHGFFSGKKNKRNFHDI